MDEARFDKLTRSVASARSRRSVLKSVLGLGAGGALASRAKEAEAVACRGGGDTCSRGNQCCSGVCDTTNADRTLRNRCTCASGQTSCRNQCIDLMSDVNNCGACGNGCYGVSDNQCLGEAICINGVCGFAPRASGTACNDSNVCTQTDTCDGHGNCVGSDPVMCNSNNPCMIDSCDPAAGCVQTPKLAGTSCDNLNPCDGEEVCDGEGRCLAGTPTVCQPLDNCHDAGVCDPSTGQCSNPMKPDGAACDDSNASTCNDTCTQGVCSGTPVDLSNDRNNCGSCGNVCGGVSDNQCLGEPICMNGTCGFAPLAAGTACNDGNACTRSDTCNGQGACMGGAAVVCNSNNPCIIDSCHPATGCVQTPKVAGSSCNDGNPCNGNEICDGMGHCMAGTPTVCHPLDDCHTAGVCNPSTGQCSNPMKPDGSACNDGYAGTCNDTCTQGVCSGTPANFNYDKYNCGACGNSCPEYTGSSSSWCGGYGTCCDLTPAGTVCCGYGYSRPSYWSDWCNPYDCDCYRQSFSCGFAGSDTCYRTVCKTCWNRCYYGYCA